MVNTKLTSTLNIPFTKGLFHCVKPENQYFESNNRFMWKARITYFLRVFLCVTSGRSTQVGGSPPEVLLPLWVEWPPYTWKTNSTERSKHTLSSLTLTWHCVCPQKALILSPFKTSVASSWVLLRSKRVYFSEGRISIYLHVINVTFLCAKLKKEIKKRKGSMGLK